MPAFVDVENLMKALDTITRRLDRKRLLTKLRIPRELRRLREYYHEDTAPAGWSFDDFVDFMISFADFQARYPTNRARIQATSESRYRPLLMVSMHFQDVCNYQVDRVKRCVVHYAALDGRIYPFCSYNSGPCHRRRVEGDFGIPLGEYRAARAACRR